MRRARVLRSAVALALGVCALQVAHARPAAYNCGETLEFKVDFTPRKAQLHLADKQYTLLRIKSARDAHYVNRKAGITLIAKKGDLSLHEGGRHHDCKLQIAP
jgi:hypothetical protein